MLEEEKHARAEERRSFQQQVPAREPVRLSVCSRGAGGAGGGGAGGAGEAAREARPRGRPGGTRPIKFDVSAEYSLPQLVKAAYPQNIPHPDQSRPPAGPGAAQRAVCGGGGRGARRGGEARPRRLRRAGNQSRRRIRGIFLTPTNHAG
eukprot:366567-Prorocentrum_minimum.AAC.1